MSPMLLVAIASLLVLVLDNNTETCLVMLSMNLEALTKKSFSTSLLGCALLGTSPTAYLLNKRQATPKMTE